MNTHNRCVNFFFFFHAPRGKRPRTHAQHYARAIFNNNAAAPIGRECYHRHCRPPPPPHQPPYDAPPLIFKYAADGRVARRARPRLSSVSRVQGVAVRDGAFVTTSTVVGFERTVRVSSRIGFAISRHYFGRLFSVRAEGTLGSHTPNVVSGNETDAVGMRWGGSFSKFFLIEKLRGKTQGKKRLDIFLRNNDFRQNINLVFFFFCSYIPRQIPLRLEMFTVYT